MNQKTILVVEDEAIVGMQIQDELNRLGYKVPLVVTNGDQVQSAVAKVKPDLVLMDIRIKGSIDGIQAAAKLRQTSDIPILFLTSYSDSVTLSRAAEILPDGYLIKPFSERELAANIEMLLLKAQSGLKGGKNLRKMIPIIDALDLSLLLFDAQGAWVHGNLNAKKVLGVEKEGPSLYGMVGITFKEFEANSSTWHNQELPFLVGGREPAIRLMISVLTNNHNTIYGYLVSLQAMGKNERDHLAVSAKAVNATLVNFLPENGIFSDHLECAGFLVPSPSGTGDFYDIFPLGPKHYVFYNLDVAGHGPLPAMIVYALRSEIRDLAIKYQERGIAMPDLAGLLAALNKKILARSENGPFFTLTMGILNSEWGEFKIVRAGHTTTLWIKENLSIEWLHGYGTALGAFSDVSFEELHGQLHPNERLILCSDGVLDALGDKSLEQGYAILGGLIRSQGHKDISTLTKSIQDACLVTKGAGHDDISLLAIGWIGKK